MGPFDGGMTLGRVTEVAGCPSRSVLKQSRGVGSGFATVPLRSRLCLARRRVEDASPGRSGGQSAGYGWMAPPAVTPKEITPLAVAMVLPPGVTVTTWLLPVADTETV